MGIFLAPVADVYSYALMLNHIHIVLRIKARDEIGWLEARNANEKDLALKWSTTFDEAIHSQRRRKPEPEKMIRHLFSAFSKWTNTRYHRSGTIFERRFERKVVHSETHLRQLIIYINRNPEKHGVTHRFDQYPWISYHALVGDDPGWLNKEKVMRLFETQENFIAAVHKTDFDDWLQGLA
jgi:hypothetical protein